MSIFFFGMIDNAALAGPRCCCVRLVTGELNRWFQDGLVGWHVALYSYSKPVPQLWPSSR